MVRTSRKQTNKLWKTQTMSLPAYIAIVFMVAAIINLVSLKIFWDSPVRQNAVLIQELTEKRLDNPFFLPIDSSEININDQVLTTTELHYLQNEIKKLAQDLDAEQDFYLDDDNLIWRLLEF